MKKKPKKQVISSSDEFKIASFGGYGTDCGLDDSQIADDIGNHLEHLCRIFDENVEFGFPGDIEDPDQLQDIIEEMIEKRQEYSGEDEIIDSLKIYNIKITVSVEVDPIDSYDVEYRVPEIKKILKFKKSKK